MYGEKIAVLNAVWLSPVIPVLHIILLRILKNGKIVIPTLICSSVYFGLWAWLTFSTLAMPLSTIGSRLQSPKWSLANGTGVGAGV